ncbi:MAG: transposase [Flavobacteriaceae bacterium]|nr:transposase [Flavobacteriaceae bacterium]
MMPLYNTPPKFRPVVKDRKMIKLAIDMRQKRRKFEPGFKAQVALAAIREKMTTAEIAQKFSVSPNHVAQWKKEFLKNSSKAFGADKKDSMEDKLESLYSKIGKLEVERDFLKKNLWKTGL